MKNTKSCTTKASNNFYNIGRGNEEALGRLLESKGFNVLLMDGSKGPVDLIATRPSLKWGIQVKTTSNPKYSISEKDVNKIYEYCHKIGAVSFLAIITKDFDKLLSVSTYSINEHNPTDIIDIFGNLIAIKLDNDYVCSMYNLKTGERISYDWM